MMDTTLRSGGRVYWITGLSGAGKTTLGGLLYGLLAGKKPNVVFLDGDRLRQVFGDDLGHAKQDRLKSAMRNSRLCKMLADQSIDVVCATISMFHECQKWNREQIEGYVEIFLDVPMQILRSRDRKGLYTNDDGQVMGIHIAEERPLKPDITIINDGSQSPDQLLAALSEQLGIVSR